MPHYNIPDNELSTWEVCESIAEYSKASHQSVRQLCLFGNEHVETKQDDIKVVELFAGVGGFRIGLERASKRYVTIWNNQWEPSTKNQDASIIYCKRFGTAGHSNVDISAVPTNEIPNCDLLCGGFPCQDYSVATTLSRSEGIEGKKGILWWQIYRILKEKGNKAPNYLIFENVDRLLVSPATQRGRDFAIILSSLSDLGYSVEWRIINAADYGMPQRRRRIYMVAFRQGSILADNINITEKFRWIMEEGIMAKAFPCRSNVNSKTDFHIEGELSFISNEFNKSMKKSPFLNSGIMINRHVYCVDATPLYCGESLTLGQILVDEKDVPEDFYISEQDLPKWEYLKGQKSIERTNKNTGHKYTYSEGSMAFPDFQDRASRTIITGEGGSAPSRFKHIVKTPSGRYRRLIPLELERLNMFPDNHTVGASDTRRAFLMGNALVTGIVEKIGLVLEPYI